MDIVRNHETAERSVNSSAKKHGVRLQMSAAVSPGTSKLSRDSDVARAGLVAEVFQASPLQKLGQDEEDDVETDDAPDWGSIKKLQRY
jgi:hypothetical protein